ncbi:FCSD flavin-binding domain-containing protein [Stappia sp.]|jgi:sulfide dehydrogenase [flavocytochrome c] flavoprotein chain|uniref:FCSD flavin-binding domain-containing protein n=1 Tax=Stappia sp. TaxID=1870903 RepID=UPI003D122646
MSSMTRRRFTQTVAGVAGAGLLTGLGSAAYGQQARPRVVVVGGGAGGATAARYLAKDSQGTIDVTLIEPTKTYYTCFFSNLYLGGFRTLESTGHTYGKLASDYGINVLHDWAVAIDRDAKTVALAGGGSVPYDKLVIAPGIDLIYDSVPGYSLEASGVMPHAWKAGTQTTLLKNRIAAMREGGTFVMVPPPNPYRCPPGPYERVSMVAHMLKQSNPTAKIIVLDPKEAFSKQALFMEGWEKHYPGMVEWLPASIHGGVEAVDVASGEIVTGLDTFKADVGNIIPAQKAGLIAENAGLANDSGFCPIEPATMASKMDGNIHVIGDACIAGDMPKSGFSANSQAKVAAMAIRADLTGSSKFPPRFSNTCWSLIATDDGVKVGARYEAGEEKIASVDSFISKTGEDAVLRKATYEESVGWYEGITADIFG